MSNYVEVYFEEEAVTSIDNGPTTRSPEELILWLLDFEG